MTVTYTTAVKNARLKAVADAIDAGSGVGVLVLMTSANAVLATIPLPKPCASQAGGVLTILGVPDSATATGAGVAAKAEFRDSTGAVVVSGLTVGGTAEDTQAGKDIVLNASTIAIGQTVAITAATITHA